MEFQQAAAYEGPEVADYGDLAKLTGEASHLGSPLHPPSHAEHPSFSDA